MKTLSKIHKPTRTLLLPVMMACLKSAGAPVNNGLTVEQGRNRCC